MANVNKAILVGNLGKDPELRDAGSGKVCNFSIATNEFWYDKDEKKQERTEWHNIVVWGKRGENCGKYLTKGRQVYVEGRIQHRTYEDKEGNTRYVDEVVANDVQFLGGGDSDSDSDRGRGDRSGGGNRDQGGGRRSSGRDNDSGGGRGGNYDNRYDDDF